MSKISNAIFNNAYHVVTSSFGNRSVIYTSAGATSSYHSGTDYGTNNKKIAQYAIEDGYIMDSNRASDGANYVWIIYPGSKLAMLHYHLDSRKVSAGQKVKRGALLGYTGMTGKATGIHLHLGVKPLTNVSNVNAVTYSVLNNIAYVDPEKVNWTGAKTATVPKSETAVKPTSKFLPAKGYWAFGDKDERVGKLASFMRKTFPSYTKAEALGNLYGNNIMAAITEFQHRTGLEADGKTGPKTLAELKKYGFKE